MTGLLIPKQERNLRETVRRIGPALVDLQRQLADVGMYRSMHALNTASKELGWEAADILSDAQRDQRMQDKAILRRLRWPDALQADPPDNDR